MSTIAQLDVILRANAQRFSPVMQQSTQQIQRMGDVTAKANTAMATFGKKVLGAVFVGGAIAASRAVMDNIDSVAKLSDRIGVATEKIVGFRHAAVLAGSSVQQMDMGLQRLGRRLQEARTRGGMVADVFKDMGINADELVRMRTDEAFIRIAESIKNLPTVAERIAASYEVFGRTGNEMLNLIMQGREGLEDAQREAERLGMTFNRLDARKVEEANDAMSRLKGATTGLIQAMVIHLAPALSVLTDKVAFLIGNPLFRWFLLVTTSIYGLKFALKGLVAIKGTYAGLLGLLFVKKKADVVSTASQAFAYKALTASIYSTTAAYHALTGATVKQITATSVSTGQLLLTGKVLKIGFFGRLGLMFANLAKSAAALGLVLKGILVKGFTYVAAAAASLLTVTGAIVAVITVLVAGLAYAGTQFNKYKRRLEDVIKTSQKFATARAQQAAAAERADKAMIARDYEGAIAALEEKRKALEDQMEIVGDSVPTVDSWLSQKLVGGNTREMVQMHEQTARRMQQFLSEQIATVERQLEEARKQLALSSFFGEVQDAIFKETYILKHGEDAWIRYQYALEGATQAQVAQMKAMQDALSGTRIGASLDEFTEGLKEQLDTFRMTNEQAQLYKIWAESLKLPVDQQKQLTKAFEQANRSLIEFQAVSLGHDIADQMEQVTDRFRRMDFTTDEIMLADLYKRVSELPSKQMLPLLGQLEELQRQLSGVANAEAIRKIEDSNRDLWSRITSTGLSEYEKMYAEVAEMHKKAFSITDPSDRDNMLHVIEERKKLIDKLQDTERFEELKKKAEKVWEETRTPGEDMMQTAAKQVRQLNELFAKGLISDDTYLRALEKLEDDLLKRDTSPIDTGEFKTIRSAFVDLAGMRLGQQEVDTPVKEQRTANQILKDIRTGIDRILKQEGLR